MDPILGFVLFWIFAGTVIGLAIWLARDPRVKWK